MTDKERMQRFLDRGVSICFDTNILASDNMDSPVRLSDKFHTVLQHYIDRKMFGDKAIHDSIWEAISDFCPAHSNEEASIVYGIVLLHLERDPKYKNRIASEAKNAKYEHFSFDRPSDLLLEYADAVEDLNKLK